MKTPDEIKIWLETEIAVHYHLPNPEPRLTPKEFMFLEKMHGETLAYIERLESDNESKQKRIDDLESRLAQVERERDALMYDFALGFECHTCKHETTDCNDFPCNDCAEASMEAQCLRWEWRGVCAENTKEDSV